MNTRKKLMSGNGQFNIMEAANNETFLQDLEAPVSKNDILTAMKNISKGVSNNDDKKFKNGLINIRVNKINKISIIKI